MSTPAEYYRSLPPICKAFGTLCFFSAAVCSFGLLSPYYMALLYGEIFYKLQVWRLITNFVYLGNFSMRFGFTLLMLARYGVQLEKITFANRTADFLWMMIFGAVSLLVFSIIPFLNRYFFGNSLIFMLVYVWSREFPDAQINIYGVMKIKGFYLPWMLLALDVIFGASVVADLLGMIAGHLHYFLTVLHPLATGRKILATPVWIHKLVDRWIVKPPTQRYVQSYVTPGRSTPPTSTPSTGKAFTGRSYRLSD